MSVKSTVVKAAGRISEKLHRKPKPAEREDIVLGGDAIPAGVTFSFEAKKKKEPPITG